ncbi:hypothetical protein D3C72_2565620 [compost metagenome]
MSEGKSRMSPALAGKADCALMSSMMIPTGAFATRVGKPNSLVRNAVKDIVWSEQDAV